MADFLLEFFSIISLLALVGYLFYPGSAKKTQGAALSLLLLYFVSAPIASFIGGLSDGEISVPLYEGVEITEDGAFYETAREAFSDGIIRILEEKYSIKEEEALVTVVGFSLEKMRAEKIKILLSGRAMLSDLPGIEEYIAGLGLGECEVKIRIG